MKALTAVHIFIFTSCLTVSLCGDDLYSIMGVRRTASQKEIKQAYKKLARELHPDKNDDPDATDKFTKINEAYETLSDPEKRQQYDDFGYTAADAGQQRGQGRGPQGFHGFQGFQGFESFFGGGGGFHFNFNDFGGGESIIDKYRINLRQYETTILPNSNKKPCIIYSYTDFCFTCMRMEGIVEKFIQELKSVGLCVATIHAGRSGDLTSHLRITSVPTIVGVINERITFFKGPVSIQSLREFARYLFPSNFMTKVTDSNLHTFLDGWTDNRVRAIFFTQKETLSARFLAPAFFYKDNLDRKSVV